MSTKPNVVQWLNEQMLTKINPAMPSEASLFKLLRLRYPVASYALFPQVRDSTGYSGSRTADAIAFGLWPSRGLEIEGFEMKVSRADWQKELKSPEKAEAVCRFCDRWWIVVSDEKIVADGELPPTWGLLAQKGEKLVVKKAAPKLEPQPMEKGFIASIMREIQNNSVPKIEIQQKLDAAYKSGQETGSVIQSHEDKFRLNNYERLTKSIEEFEKVSGVKLDAWNGKSIGEAVRYVMHHGPDRIERELNSLKKQLERTLLDIDRSLIEAKKVYGDEGAGTIDPECNRVTYIRGEKCHEKYWLRLRQNVQSLSLPTRNCSELRTASKTSLI